MHIRTNRVRRTARTESKGSVSAPEPEAPEDSKPVTRTVRINLDEEIEDDGGEFSAVLSVAFDAAAFKTAWEEKAKELFVEVQDAIIETYVWNDVLTSLEDAISSNQIDANVVINDEHLTNEVEALLAYKLLLLFAKRQFAGEEYIAVRNFLLQPEGAAKLQKTGAAKGASALVKELWESMQAGKAASPNASGNPVGHVQPLRKAT